MKKGLFWGAGFLPVVFTAVALNFLPDKIPSVYGGGGEVAAWGSKYLIFLGAFIPLCMCLFFHAFNRYFRKKSRNSADDKKEKESMSNAGAMLYCGMVSCIFFNLLQCYWLYLAFKAKNNTAVVFSDGIVIIALGVFLMLIGNVFPKAKPNGVFGLRTHWSGKNDMTWAVSQKHGGIMIVIDGLLLVVCGALIKNEFIFSIAVPVIVLSIIPAAFIISYFAYKKYGNIEKAE